MTSNDLLITRIFDAPREAVWKAWTEPWRYMHWNGPRGFTSPSSVMDVKVGGKNISCMRSPDGKDFWSTGVYLEVDEPSRLVMTDSFADEKGNVVPASYYGFTGDFPLELLVSVSLEDIDGRTKLVLRHSGFVKEDLKLRSDMRDGWNEMFDKLEAFLAVATGTRIVAEPGTRDIVTSFTYNAPRDAVFHAMTDPKFIPRWWGPRRYTTTIIEHDFRPGGRWRYLQRDADGKEYGFHGTYSDVVPAERMAKTFEFEGMPGHVATEITTFDDLGGKTLVTTTSTFQSVEDRDGMLAAGAEEGTVASNIRIIELLESKSFIDQGVITCNPAGCTASS